MTAARVVNNNHKHSHQLQSQDPTSSGRLHCCSSFDRGNTASAPLQLTLTRRLAPEIADRSCGPTAGSGRSRDVTMDSPDNQTAQIAEDDAQVSEGIPAAVR